MARTRQLVEQRKAGDPMTLPAYMWGQCSKEARRDQLCEILARSSKPLTSGEIVEFMPPMWALMGKCGKHELTRPNWIGFHHIGGRCWRIQTSTRTDVGADLQTLRGRGLVDRSGERAETRWRYIGPRTDLGDLAAQLPDLGTIWFR